MGYGTYLKVNIVDPASGAVFGELENGDTFYQPYLPFGGTLVAVTDAEGVRFEFDGQFVRSEVYAPFSLSGDVQGVVNAMDLGAGEHVLTITRFATDADARTNRLPGQVTTIRFTISIDPADAAISPGGPNGEGGTPGPGGNPGGYPGYGNGGGSTGGGVVGTPPVAAPGAILGGGGPSALQLAAAPYVNARELLDAQYQQSLQARPTMAMP